MYALERICLCINQDRPITQSERDLLHQELVDITSNEAQLLYVDLCAIVDSVETKLQPSLNTLTFEYTHSNCVNFYQQMMEVGNFVDRVADAMTYTSEQRQEKWNAEVTLHEQLCKKHKTVSEFFNTWSQFLLSSRQINEHAYQQILLQVPTNPKLEWQIVIASSVVVLQSKPRTWWSGVQITKLSKIEQQALVHKLDICRSFAPEIIDDLRMKLNCAIFYTIDPNLKLQDPRIQPKHKPHKMRYWRKKVYNFIFSRQRRKQNACRQRTVLTCLNIV